MASVRGVVGRVLRVAFLSLGLQLTGPAGAAEAGAAAAALADELARRLADDFVPVHAGADGVLAERQQAINASVQARMRAPLTAMVRVVAAERGHDGSVEAITRRVLARVDSLRQSAPLRWPAGLREERFRRAFDRADASRLCAASPSPQPLDEPDRAAAIELSIEALFSTAAPAPAPQPELSLRLVDAVADAMTRPGAVHPPFPEQAVAAMGLGAAQASDESGRRALCMVSVWWAQRALAKAPAARQQDIDAYVHAAVSGGARQPWLRLPDHLGLPGAWVTGAAPGR